MALKEAVAERLWTSASDRYPIAVWRDGNAAWIPPKEIVVPEVK